MTSEAQNFARSPLFLAASGLALTAISSAVVLYDAVTEPYPLFRWADAALILGLGPAVVPGFIAWVFACRRGRGPFIVVAAVLWAVINMLYLSFAITGYISDLLAR